MKNMIELGRCDCRWPIDAADGVMFCAAVIDKGSSYCKEHRAVALRPTRFLTDRSFRKSYDHVRAGTQGHDTGAARNPPVDSFVKNFGKPYGNRHVDYSVFLKESA